MSKPSLQLATVVSRPFGQNTYLAWLDGAQECLLVDPGFEPGKIMTALTKNGLQPVCMLITHGHSDHIGGIAAIKELWPDCPIVIGVNESDKLTNPEKNLSAQFGFPLIAPTADRLVSEGDVVSYAGFDLEVREIPGHSSGHVVFICRDAVPPFVFAGDVLFAGSIGRTDFPDGDFDQLAAGIRKKLYVLPDETIVLPGHGLRTTIGTEKQSNPFVPGD